MLPAVVAICCKLFQARVDCRHCCRRFTNCRNVFQTAKICGFHVPMRQSHFLLRRGSKSVPMESNPPRRRKTSSDMVHLRSLLSALPATNTGRVAAAWAEIEAGLARGMKLREVWEAAKLDGLEIPYPQFRVYVSRLRRRRQRSSASAPQPPHALTNGDSPPLSPASPDPFSNLREQREKKKQSGFEYDPFSINKSLID